MTRLILPDQVVTIRCQFCPWTVTGVLDAAHADFEQHRKQHPESKPYRRRARPKAKHEFIVSDKTLEQNLSAARLAGASGRQPEASE